MLPNRLTHRLALAGAVLALVGSPAFSQREPQTSTQNPGPLPGPLQVPMPPQQNPMPDPQQAPQPMAGDQGLVRRMSVDQLMEIARGLGYSDVQRRSDTIMNYRAYGHTVSCFIERDGDLRLVYALRKRGVSVQQMNTWNRDRRLSRAFLDKDGDPVLETDLLTDASMTANQVKATFRTFETSVNVFRKFLGAAN